MALSLTDKTTLRNSDTFKEYVNNVLVEYATEVYRAADTDPGLRSDLEQYCIDNFGSMRQPNSGINRTLVDILVCEGLELDPIFGADAELEDALPSDLAGLATLNSKLKLAVQVLIGEFVVFGLSGV